jgi:hypothetical protein
MTIPPDKPLKIFCSYSRKDEEHLNDLRDWLRGLERQGFIESWHDREIAPGWEWEEAIDKNLRTADIILLLVSTPFMASDYVYEQEISKAVERHERGEARVIPIVVRPAYWKWANFGRLQALPKDAKPITTWPNQDEAWLDVVEGVRKAVEELLVERQERAAKERYRKELDAAWADRKLSDAEAQRLAALASELGLGANTTADIEREVMGDVKEAIPERHERAARGRARKEQLDELYARARQLHQNKDWQAVVDVFERIRAEDPDYPDHSGILGSAHEALEKARREDTLRRYREAVEWAWTDEQLTERDAQRLGTFANRLNVSRSDASAIERKVMGETKEEIVERQERAAKAKARAATERMAGRSAATDAARRKAEELGVDLAKVRGSGADGRIIVRDVVGRSGSNISRGQRRKQDEVLGGTKEGILERQEQEVRWQVKEGLRASNWKYRGYTAYDNRREKIGKVDDLFVDEADREEYIRVKLGFLGTRSVLIPMNLAWFNHGNKAINIRSSKDRIKNAPQVSGDVNITPAYMARIRSYFDLGRSSSRRGR